jgi:hypothetical protein
MYVCMISRPRSSAILSLLSRKYDCGTDEKLTSSNHSQLDNGHDQPVGRMAMKCDDVYARSRFKHLLVFNAFDYSSAHVFSRLLVPSVCCLWMLQQHVSGIFFAFHSIISYHSSVSCLFSLPYVCLLPTCSLNHQTSYALVCLLCDLIECDDPYPRMNRIVHAWLMNGQVDRHSIRLCVVEGFLANAY